MSSESLLPDRIAQARERSSLSQADLATKLGLHAGTVAKWERGERTPSVDDLCRLADALAVSVGWLLGRKSRGRPFTTKDGVNPGPRGPHAIPNAWACMSKPGGCDCHCHAVRAGKLKRPPVNTRPDCWLPEQDALVRERLARGWTPEQIAAALTERWPDTPRTAMAVKNRANRHLGLSLFDGWTSSTELRQLLGVSRSTFDAWRQRGLLRGAESFGRWPRYLDHEIEAFVREHAGVLFDPRRVRDPKLKAIAETAGIVNRRRQVSA